jgi:hypothetical protein
MLLRLVYVAIRNWSTENIIVPKQEQMMNDELFVGQSKNEPAFFQYQNTVNHIGLLTNGNAKAIILCGPPGMSKTYIVKRTLYMEKYIPQKEYIVVKGATMGISDVYSFLYENRHKIIVFDDFDTPLRNPDIVNMIKSITDTYGKRILAMPREKMVQSGGDQEIYNAPSRFEFTGKVIIITNLDKSQIEPALMSRAPVHEVKFDSKKILEMIDGMIIYINPSVSIELKHEVLDYLHVLYKKDPKNTKIDFRTFVTAIDARIGNPEGWKEMVKVMV